MAWKYSSKYLNGSIFLVFFGSSIIFQIHFKYLSLKEKQLQFFNWHFIFRKNKNLNVKYMVSVPLTLTRLPDVIWKKIGNPAKNCFVC